MQIISCSSLQLVSRILNDYLQATGKTRTFSFGKSSHYKMEFSDLIYRHWATCLILESFENRLLKQIQLAKEAIESFIKESEFKPGEGPPHIASPMFSTSTIFANDMQKFITMDQGLVPSVTAPHSHHHGRNHSHSLIPLLSLWA